MGYNPPGGGVGAPVRELYLEEGAYGGANIGLQKDLDEYKISLRRKCEHVTEGSDKPGDSSLLNSIYTDLYITEGQNEEVNTQHEVMQLDTPFKINNLHDIPIRGQEIFKALPGQYGAIRVVLTSGIAGVGKTFLVQKFTLDWAKGLENQDINVVVLLSFRELNIIREEQHSLLTLLHVFYPTLQKFLEEMLAVCKPLFIFDGLDESRFLLDFTNSQLVPVVTQKSSVKVLLTNLINGNLLPSALIWITSRPVAANQIPPSCVNRVTEVRGFADAKQEEYFRKRFSDEDLSSRIISHIWTSRSLQIMCGIPVFCWITATVLEHMLTIEKREVLPKTMTEMYSHFLLVQTETKKIKYNEEHERGLKETDREVLLKLGRLAFEQLEKGNIMFYQEDLEECGLDITEASVFSGVCTEIFKTENVIFQKPIYCFVHLSVQEYLAAVYIFNCYTNRNTDVLKNFLTEHNSNSPLEDFLKNIMEKCLKNENGQLDLFVRFIHGLSVKPSNRLLQTLLGQTENRTGTIQRVINNLKKQTTFASPDRSINIFHCLMEMNDLSVHQDIQQFLKSENRSEFLSEIHCSALAYMLQMSQEVLDELDLKKYRTSTQGRQRLIPAVRNCRKARLAECELSETHCKVVASALMSSPSHLIEVDLTENKLSCSAVEHLCAGLRSSNCRLEILRLRNCRLSEDSCTCLVKALRSNLSHLTELDLSWNKGIKDAGAEELCGFLKSPHCRLKILRLQRCRLSEINSTALASALKSNPSHLTELDLSWNEDVKDAGVRELCGFLESPRCSLMILSLFNCSLTKISCASLVSALKSNPSHLTELDLRGNSLVQSDVEQLLDVEKSMKFELKSLK
ncbi:NLR family CARD domain-containing protein 3-like [Girardinichthys multiradiatus]|uniref:NLR family CARD domain-containing protein 3-like n=1 Tax=Girardinichthys multiradiatus TaxID=208333 RepID=UPI001FAC4CF6|nr:NLR family CARD domain-containing protein 3-like [Girardinichthys multiradiatus]